MSPCDNEARSGKDEWTDARGQDVTAFGRKPAHPQNVAGELGAPVDGIGYGIVPISGQPAITNPAFLVELAERPCDGFVEAHVEVGGSSSGSRVVLCSQLAVIARQVAGAGTQDNFAPDGQTLSFLGTDDVGSATYPLPPPAHVPDSGTMANDGPKCETGQVAQLPSGVFP